MHEPAHLSRRSLAAALPLAALAGASAAATAAIHSNPVLAQIELHRALRQHFNTVSWEDDDTRYHAACADEEAAIQAFGDMMPTSQSGAVAQLQYMVHVKTFPEGPHRSRAAF